MKVFTRVIDGGVRRIPSHPFQMGWYIYLVFGLDGLCLTLVLLADAFTPPQNVAHSGVASAHHNHRNQVGRDRENNIVSGRHR